MSEQFINFPPGGGGGSGGGASSVAGYLIATGSGSPPLNARALVGANGISITDQGPGLNAVVSGTVYASLDAQFLFVSGTAGAGPTPPNARKLVAGPNVSIVDGGTTLTINAGTTGGSGDPNATYVVLSATGSLNNERVLTAGQGITIIDGGAGNPVTIRTSGDGAADVSASYIVVGTTGSLPNERQLAAGTNTQLTDNGPGGTLVISSAGVYAGVFSGSVYVVTGAYTVGVSDGVLLMKTALGSLTASLPDPSIFPAGKMFWFKDYSGNALNSPFVVNPGVATIDGVSGSYSYPVTWGTLKLLSDGVSWFTIN